MYEYYLRIYDKYRQEIQAIVIYTGRNVPRVHNYYHRGSGDTYLRYHFISYQVREQNEEELMRNSNPFAIVVLANLYLIQSHNNPPKRLALKKKVYELAENSNYDLAKIAKTAYLSVSNYGVASIRARAISNTYR